MIEPIKDAYSITLENSAVSEEGNLVPAKIVFSENGFIDLMQGDSIYFRLNKTDLEVMRKIIEMVEMPY